MCKVVCVALPWCQLSWRSSVYKWFPVKASKLIQTYRKVIMSCHNVIVFIELSYWISELKISTGCVPALPDMAKSGLYSEIWRSSSAPCYSLIHSWVNVITKCMQRGLLSGLVLWPHGGLWWSTTMTDKSFPSAVYQIRNSVRNNKRQWENMLNNKSCQH